MKILLSSYAFPPCVGGLQAVSLMLASEFTQAGHEVRVLTQTPPGNSSDRFPFEVIREPSLSQVFRLSRWADIVFHNNISLLMAWPLLFIDRPWVVAHHIWISGEGTAQAIKGWFKRLALRRATGIAISEAVAKDFSTPCVIIPNPYDAETFRRIDAIRREQALVFVGRFVDDKGLPMLLQALRQLAARGQTPKLTVVGAGPEDRQWRRLVTQQGLSDQVEFVGVKLGRELAELLNAHRVMVVPSLWDEPFGLVALEGIACGCMLVGSEGGGLKAAIGPAGITFPNGDVKALADRLATALSDQALAARCEASASTHLAPHRPAAVAGRYLEVFSQVLAKARCR